MKHPNITDIITKYTTGEKTLEETNAALKEAGATFHIDPARNLFTPEELASTRIGETPEEANGWGLLDTGTGTYDKVQIADGHLVNCDMGESYALVIIGGKLYKVEGDTLTDY